MRWSEFVISVNWEKAPEREQQLLGNFPPSFRGESQPQL